ncbi:MAG: AEC family transporter [Sedimentibacter sp.]|uniref:AEC family transporter n=1 Tax=Sedimentibacter sp. TaxID=1960295 RepID=UPI0031582D48
MSAILVKVCGFMLIIVSAYIFKKIGIFKAEDSRVISRIILYVTLPAAVIVSFQETEVTASLLTAIVLGVGLNFTMLFAARFAARKRDGKTKALYMLHAAGYNIGNFIVPVTQTFLSAASVVTICIYDIGNAAMTLGVNYSLASNEAEGGSRISISSVFKKMVRSVPLDTYIIMFVLSVLKIRLPETVVTIASMFGNANAFLGMFMIGLAFELNLNTKDARDALSIIALRYGSAVIFALIIYFLLPLPFFMKQALTLVVFAPVPSVAVVFAAQCGCDLRLSGVVSSLCIPISMAFITVLLLLVA